MAPASRDAHFACDPNSPAKPKLGGIRDAIEILIGLGADADSRANIGHEAIRVGAVVLDDRPGIRPGAKEQLNETMIENVEKARKGIVVGEHVVIGLLGGREGERALRSEQTKVFDEDLERLVVALLDTGKVRGRKIHERVLAEQDELVAPCRAVADAGPILVRALEMPQHREVIETATALLPDYAERSRLPRGRS